jgi:hypothetical protein
MRLARTALLLFLLLLLAGTIASAIVSFQRAESIDLEILRAWYYVYPFIPLGIVLGVIYGLWRTGRPTGSA